MMEGLAAATVEPKTVMIDMTYPKAHRKRTVNEIYLAAKRDRFELAKMIEQLCDDDTVVVTRLDQLTRATRICSTLPKR